MVQLEEGFSIAAFGDMFLAFEYVYGSVAFCFYDFDVLDP